MRTNKPSVFDKRVKMEPPRWPGAPPFCPVAHAGAYESPKAIKAFLDGIAFHGAVTKQWQCRHCGRWHYECLTERQLMALKHSK